MNYLFKKCTVTVFIASFALNSVAAERDPHEVKDLRYGESLYHFYKEEYFTSITNLMVAKERSPITKQDIDPELLLGGLYLYYGLHQNANHIFSSLIENNTSEKIQDRAWFNIGKMLYQGKLFTEANTTLKKVQGSLSKDREAERHNMLANTYLKQKNFAAAFESIKQLKTNQDWLVYAQYNLGISLIKSGKSSEGTKILKELSVLKTNDPELKALRDKTNVALGYAYIRQQLPKVAIKYLQRVRLKGPLSAKALLGIGWANQQLFKLEKALIPWMELRNWPVIDTAVQESLLAIPYTLEKMNENHLALKHYNYAIENYKKELTTLTSTLHAIKGGELLLALRPAIITENVLAPEYKTKLPDSISEAYIQHLVNDVDFQNIHRNYLDLMYLRKNLLKWKNQFSAYYLMLKERSQYYSKQQLSTNKDPRLNLINKLKAKRDMLAIKVQQIERQQNIYALSSEDEEDIVTSLKKVGRSLQRLKGRGDFSEENEKYKLLNGLMHWDLATDYTPRYWKVKNELNQVDKALGVSSKRLQSLVVSRKNAPLSFIGYNNRIKQKEKKLNTLLNRIKQIIALQEKLIEKQALVSLEKRHRQITAYHVRARYSLARLHDQLTLPSNQFKEEGLEK